MARNNYTAIGAQFLIGLIALPFKMAQAYMQARERQEMQEAKLRNMESTQQRREVLNHNTMMMIQSRHTMDRQREARTAQMELDNQLKHAQIDKIKAEIRLANARIAAMEAMTHAAGPDADLDGAVFHVCGKCGKMQSRHLGNTCQSCGSQQLKPMHLDNRN